MRRRWWITILVALGLVTVGAAPAHAAPGGPGGPGGPERATGWYLALGDSLAAGYQPTTGVDLEGGYVGGVLEAVQAGAPKTKLVNLACPGERITSLVSGGRCAYEEGTQLAQAVEFLHAHEDKTRLVTIDIGANDIQRCANAATASIDLTCVASGLADVQRLLPQALAQVRAVAPDAQIVVLDYYNPFLAAWGSGPAGQLLAQQSMALQGLLNGIIAAAAASVGAQVAQVAAAFESTNATPTTGGVPMNVALICAWTWMCSRLDIHANDTGYAVMAQAVAARL